MAGGGQQKETQEAVVLPDTVGSKAFRAMTVSAKYTSGPGVPQLVKDGAGFTKNGEKRQLCHKIPNKELAQAYNATADPAVKQMLVDFSYSSENIDPSKNNADHSRREAGMRKGSILKNDFNKAAERWHVGLTRLKNMGPVGTKAAEAVLAVSSDSGSAANKKFIASEKKSSYTNPKMKALIDEATEFCTRQETEAAAATAKKEQAVTMVKQKQKDVQTKSKTASASSARTTERKHPSAPPRQAPQPRSYHQSQQQQQQRHQGCEQQQHHHQQQ